MNLISLFINLYYYTVQCLVSTKLAMLGLNIFKAHTLMHVCMYVCMYLLL